MTLTLRTRTATGATTKGARLTSSELDGNFLHLLDRGAVSVKDFGAVGDGVTNDNAAVADAMADAMTAGQALYFPNGTYLLTGWTQFAVTSDLTLFAHFDATLKGTSSLRLLDPQNGRIRLSGLKFDTWEYVVQTGADTTYTTPTIHVQRCWFTSVNFPIDHQRPCTEPIIEFNRIDTYRNGIRIGQNTYADQDKWANHRIVGNRFKDGVQTSASDAYAILVYGKQAVISDNVVDTVTGASTSGAFGIYGKLRYSVISCNTITAIGTAGTSTDIRGIILKGAAANDTANGVQGFSNVVSDNVVYGDGSKTIGITIGGAEANSKATGNICENCLKGLSAEGTANLFQLSSNKVVGPANTSGFIGINLNHTGDDCQVTSNAVDTTFNAINVNTGNARNIKLSDNDMTNCGGVAILCSSGGTKDGFTITGNHVDGATRFVYFDGAITKLICQNNNATALTDASNLWIDTQAATIKSGVIKDNFPITIATADATSTPAFKIHAADDVCVTLTVRAQAVQSDGSNRALYWKHGVFYRDGGDMQQSAAGTTTLVADDESDAGWGTAALGVTGSQARVLITGKAGPTDIFWSLRPEVEISSTA